MAKILFTWELGRGLGHLVRYKALVASLVDDGHQVFYIARNAEKVRLVNPQSQIHVQELQPEFAPKHQQINDPGLASFSTLLFNCGFSNSENLARRLQRWRIAMGEIKPDCIIADHSPTAVLANKTLGFPLIVAGNGFTLPPAEQPMRLFQPEYVADLEQNRQFETRLCEIMNAGLHQVAIDTDAIASPAELFEARHCWLMTFEELDCYGGRKNADYVGTYPNEEFGQDFRWPKAAGPKVFAYLQSPKALEALGSWAKRTHASLCLIVPGLYRKYRHIFENEFVPSQTFLSENPVKFSAVAAAANLGITNGNANILANLSLAGVPQLALPVSMENYLEAQRLPQIGCGLMASGLDFSTLGVKLDELVDNAGFRQAAQRLSEKYSQVNRESQTRQLRHNLGEVID